MRPLRSISTTRDSSVRPNVRNSMAGSAASRWHTDFSALASPAFPRALNSAVIAALIAAATAGKTRVDDDRAKKASQNLPTPLSARGSRS